MKALDIVGQRFGLLVVTGPAAPQGKDKAWSCRCDCGARSEVTTGRLRSGNTKSCGCRKRSVLGESTTTHGGAGTRTHRIWKAMRTRCNNPNTKAYARYGGRGVTVCDRWDSFENFLADMGEAPPGKSIDRKDNDKGYNKGNCRWATPKEQAHNMRVNRWVTYQGETMILADWARRFNVDASTLRKQWIKRGVIVL